MHWINYFIIKVYECKRYNRRTISRESYIEVFTFTPTPEYRPLEPLLPFIRQSIQEQHVEERIGEELLEVFERKILTCMKVYYDLVGINEEVTYFTSLQSTSFLWWIVVKVWLVAPCLKKREKCPKHTVTIFRIYMIRQLFKIYRNEPRFTFLRAKIRFEQLTGAELKMDHFSENT